MKIARIHCNRTYIFCNPDNLIEWIILKFRKYKKHHTPIGSCYIKPRAKASMSRAEHE